MIESPIKYYLGFDSAKAKIEEAKKVLATPTGSVEWTKAAQTVMTTLTSLAEGLNIQNCKPITVFAAKHGSLAADTHRDKPLKLRYSLKTGYLWKTSLPGQRQRVNDPFILAHYANKIL